MFVIVTESVPERLRGFLSRWLLEVRAGVYVGDYSIKVRLSIWDTVVKNCGDGNAVLVWNTPSEAGYGVQTTGTNARTLRDIDGVELIQYKQPVSRQEEIMVNF